MRLLSDAANTWSDLHPAETIDHNEMCVAELQHFLDCVRGNQSPIVSGVDGRRVLEIALAAKQSAQEPGSYTSTVEFPGGILNVGSYLVGVALARQLGATIYDFSILCLLFWRIMAPMWQLAPST